MVAIFAGLDSRRVATSFWKLLCSSGKLGQPGKPGRLGEPGEPGRLS